MASRSSLFVVVLVIFAVSTSRGKPRDWLVNSITSPAEVKNAFFHVHGLSMYIPPLFHVPTALEVQCLGVAVRLLSITPCE